MRVIEIYGEDTSRYILLSPSDYYKTYDPEGFVEMLALPHSRKVVILTLREHDVIDKRWINGKDIVEDDKLNASARCLINGEAGIDDFNAVWSKLTEATALERETAVDNRRFLMCVDDEDVAMIVDDLGRVLTYSEMLQLWRQPHSGMYYLHIINFSTCDYHFTTMPAIEGVLADALQNLLSVAKPLSRTEFDAIWTVAPDVFTMNDKGHECPCACGETGECGCGEHCKCGKEEVE